LVQGTDNTVVNSHTCSALASSRQARV
jgi:hypothetical protein